MRYVTAMFLGLAVALSGGCYRSTLEPADATFLKPRLGYVPHDYGSIRRLPMRGPEVTDEDMTLVARCELLDTLDLRGASVTDAGLSRLPRGVPNRVILLSDTAVTSEGVMRLLERHRSLELIALERTSVDADTIEKIKQRGVSLCVAKTGADGKPYMLIQD